MSLKLMLFQNYLHNLCSINIDLNNRPFFRLCIFHLNRICEISMALLLDYYYSELRNKGKKRPIKIV